MANGSYVPDNLVIGMQEAIVTDDDLNTELAKASDEIEEAVGLIESVDYAEALDTLETVQEIINRAHAYLSGKIE